MARSIDDPSLQAEEDLNLPPRVEGFSDRRVNLVRKAVEDWIRQLIDLGGRNNLLHYRDLKQGTLDLTDADPGALSKLLLNRSIKFSALFADVDERTDALRRARAIHNKSRENFEEKGLDTLYLGCGLATWENKRGEWAPKAPVLFRPAQLRPLGAAQDEFELSLVEEMDVNPSLLQLLKVDFECEPDPEDLVDRIEGVIDEAWELDAAYHWLKSNALRVPGFDIERRLVLANFAYAKLPMVRDLENAFDELVAHELIAAIAGDEEARDRVRASDVPPESIPAPDQLPLADEFLVLDADASQNYAINSVLAGASLIIKGPPGTGKSQTISNLVAALVARGKKVLFVAEKRAAIDAVLKRLHQQQLGDLVLDLHGGATSRRTFAQVVKHALAASRLAPRVDRSAELRQVEKRRSQLNAYVAALHEVRQPWNISVYAIRAELLQFSDNFRTGARFRGEVLQQLDAERQQYMRDDIAQYVRLGALDIPTSGSPWARAQIVTSEEVQAAYALVDDLDKRTLPRALAGFERACFETGLPSAQTTAEWRESLDLWRGIQDTLKTFDSRVFEQDLDAICTALAPAGCSLFSRLNAHFFSRNYRAARRSLKSVVVRQGRVANSEFLRVARDALDQLRHWKERGGAGAPIAPAQLADLFGPYQQLLVELERLGQTIRTEELADLGFSELGRLLHDLLEDQSTLVKLPEIYRLRKSLSRAGMDDFIEALAARRVSEAASVKTFRYTWLQSILDHLALSDGNVGAFDADSHDFAVDDYRNGDREHIETSSSRVRRICAEQSTRTRDQHRDQAEIVQHQANLKRRHMPVRSLVRTAPDVLLALKPCWAMSPLVVSQLLPPRAYFDVVIFDEASQITPADAVTSILRGKQLVVAGDERQLPPTTFFLSDTPSDEEEREELDVPMVAGTVGFESILDALPSLLRFRMLQWHYRSRDERLIAFSNAHIYDRILTTFPGVGGASCLVHITVPWRPGMDTNSPSSEVDAVVDLVVEHARVRPDESLGVITMGIKHANRIEEAFRQRLQDDPALDEEIGDFFGEERDERFFVKNIERVQGDERDAIILSVGYGKNERGQLVYRFGPLLQEGGERRLNVAVTRAKRRLSLVTSFSFDDMDPERLNSEGMKLLRQYLQYVDSAGENFGDRMIEKPALNPFEVDVRDTLAREGLKLIPQFGASGYWIDFAVMHPISPGRCVLALECDGATYHSSQSARDRDRLRQEQLERLGWHFHRIWSTEWFYHKPKAVEKVLAAYDHAMNETPSEEGETAASSSPLASSSELLDASKQLRRAGPRPPLRRYLPIAEYTQRQLVMLINWIESDDVLRTEDELLTEVMSQLGMGYRGRRIVEAITSAIRAARAPSSNR